nr:capsular polysaccharide synthesis protein [Bacteroides sp. ET71]
MLYRAGGKELVERYKDRSNEACEPIEEDSPVWFCWWQGEETMPDVAKACLNSIKMHADRHPVIVITEANHGDYVDLPDYIRTKVKQGKISLTHLSDILRMALLAKHGGIWIDSTVLIPCKHFNSFIRPDRKFWTCHHVPIYHNISRGGWVGFFVACGRNNLLPSFMNDFFLLYWKTQTKLIVYLLIDYAFAIARKYIPSISRMVEEVPVTAMGPLGKCLNDEYVDGEWRRFCTDYDFHKLTYKIKLQRTTPEGKNTYYGHIMETYGPDRGEPRGGRAYFRRSLFLVSKVGDSRRRNWFRRSRR